MDKTYGVRSAQLRNLLVVALDAVLFFVLRDITKWLVSVAVIALVLVVYDLLLYNRIRLQYHAITFTSINPLRRKVTISIADITGITLALHGVRPSVIIYTHTRRHRLPVCIYTYELKKLGVDLYLLGVDVGVKR